MTSTVLAGVGGCCHSSAQGVAFSLRSVQGATRERKKRGSHTHTRSGEIPGCSSHFAKHCNHFWISHRLRLAKERTHKLVSKKIKTRTKHEISEGRSAPKHKSWFRGFWGQILVILFHSGFPSKYNFGQGKWGLIMFFPSRAVLWCGEELPKGVY